MSNIFEDEKMPLKFTLNTSIKGIGEVNCLMTITNFTSFSNPRSYALYVGVIAFDQTSDTSNLGKKG